jgi:hypothetical protein
VSSRSRFPPPLLLYILCLLLLSFRRVILSNPLFLVLSVHPSIHPSTYISRHPFGGDSITYVHPLRILHVDIWIHIPIFLPVYTFLCRREYLPCLLVPCLLEYYSNTSPSNYPTACPEKNVSLPVLTRYKHPFQRD